MHYLMQKDISEYGLYENCYKIKLYIKVSKPNPYINVIESTLSLLWKLFTS